MRLTLQRGTVDLDRAVYHRDGVDVPLRGKEVALLRYLAERPDEVVSHDELLTEVFGFHPNARTRVLSSTLRRLRAQLGESAHAPVHLHTVYGVGVRFVPLREQAPGEAFPLLGRTAAIRALHEHRRGALWVVGPGGVGKSTLVARTMARAGRGYWVDLSSIHDPGHVEPAVIDQLPLATATPGALERWAVDQEGLLIVLDNAEQVLEAVETLASRLERAAPDARLWVTSRVRPPGVTAFRLDPLTDDQSLALLERRVGASLPPDVARAALAGASGLPLVLELLAHRIRALGAHKDVVASLAGLEVGEGRQGSARATVSWSLQQLSGGARDTCRRLAFVAHAVPPTALRSMLSSEGVSHVHELERHGLLRPLDEGVRLLPVVAEVVRADAEAGPARAALAEAIVDAHHDLARRLRGPEAGDAHRDVARQLPTWLDLLDPPATASVLEGLLPSIAEANQVLRSLQVRARLRGLKRHVAQAGSPSRLAAAMAQLHLQWEQVDEARAWLDRCDDDDLAAVEARITLDYLLGRRQQSADVARSWLGQLPVGHSARPRLAYRDAIGRQGADRHEALEEAQRICERTGDAVMWGQVLVARGMVAEIELRPREALALFHHARALIDAMPPSVLQAKLATARAAALLAAGRLPEALSAADDARAVARTWGMVGMHRAATLVAMHARLLSGRQDEVLEPAWDLVRRTLPSGAWFASTSASTLLACAGFLAGDVEATVAGIGHLLDARTLGPDEAAVPGLALAALAFAVGHQPRTAARLLHRARQHTIPPRDVACLDVVEAVVLHHAEARPTRRRALVRGVLRHPASDEGSFVDCSAMVRLHVLLHHHLTGGRAAPLPLGARALQRLRRRLSDDDLAGLDPNPST